MGFVDLSLASLAIPLAVSAFLLFLFIWFKAMMARAFGAERGKKRWVLLSVVVSFLLQIILSVAVIFIFYSGVGADSLSIESISEDGGVALVATFVSFLLGVLIFSQCVKLGYFKSLVATIVCYIPMVAVLVGVGIISAMMFGKQQGIDMSQMMSMASMSTQGVSDEQLILAAEEVCACGDDQEMLMNKLMAYGFMAASYESINADSESLARLDNLNNKVTACSEGGVAMVSSSDSEMDHDSMAVIIPSEQNTIEVVEDTGADDDGSPRYREFKLSEVKQYIGTKVRVYRHSADPMEGKLVSYSDGNLKVLQRRYGGNVTFPIASKDVQSLEAYY